MRTWPEINTELSEVSWVVNKSILVRVVVHHINLPSLPPCLLRGSGLASLLTAAAAVHCTPTSQTPGGYRAAPSQDTPRCQGLQPCPGDSHPSSTLPRLAEYIPVPTPDDSLEVTAMQQSALTQGSRCNMYRNA